MQHHVPHGHWQTTETREYRERPYAPLLDTARLYAGWLMAWYAAIFLLAGQRALGRLPIGWDWVDGLAQSPLVIRFSFATFAFLLLSTLHRALKGGAIFGVVLAAVWVMLVMAFLIVS